jgi:hypothetical protein
MRAAPGNLTRSEFHPDDRVLLASVGHASGYFGSARRSRTYHETRFPMTSTSESPPPTTPTFRHNLIRVIAAQVGALLLLWLLQSRYTS